MLTRLTPSFDAGNNSYLLLSEKAFICPGS
jgi:hypothetical protein